MVFSLIIAYRMNRHLYRSFSYPAIIGVLILLIFKVTSSQIESVGGAQRWLEIGGRNFQPSELAKIALPMALAKWITTNQDKIRSFRHGFFTGGRFDRRDVNIDLIAERFIFRCGRCCGRVHHPLLRRRPLEPLFRPMQRRCGRRRSGYPDGALPHGPYLGLVQPLVLCAG